MYVRMYLCMYTSTHTHAAATQQTFPKLHNYNKHTCIYIHAILIYVHIHIHIHAHAAVTQYTVQNSDGDIIALSTFAKDFGTEVEINDQQSGKRLVTIFKGWGQWSDAWYVIYIYIYIYIYTHTHKHIYIHIYKCSLEQDIYACMYVYIYACTYVYIS